MIRIDTTAEGYMVLLDITYCDHMGSSEQILQTIPLEVSKEEWEMMSLSKRFILLEEVIGAAFSSRARRDKVITDLLLRGKAVLRTYPCPYCK